MRIGDGVAKGYYATDLHDAWARYCPPPPESPLQGLQTALPAQ